MTFGFKPRLRSIEDIMLTQASGGNVSNKQIDAVHEEALEIVRAALDGDEGLSDLDIPFLCAALHFWRDELTGKMRRNHPDDLETEAVAYTLMRRHYQAEAVSAGGDK